MKIGIGGEELDQGNNTEHGTRTMPPSHHHRSGSSGGVGKESEYIRSLLKRPSNVNERLSTIQSECGDDDDRFTPIMRSGSNDNNRRHSTSRTRSTTDKKKRSVSKSSSRVGSTEDHDDQHHDERHRVRLSICRHASDGDVEPEGAPGPVRNRRQTYDPSASVKDTMKENGLYPSKSKRNERLLRSQDERPRIKRPTPRRHASDGDVELEEATTQDTMKWPVLLEEKGQQRRRSKHLLSGSGPTLRLYESDGDKPIRRLTPIRWLTHDISLKDMKDTMKENGMYPSKSKTEMRRPRSQDERLRIKRPAPRRHASDGDVEPEGAPRPVRNRRQTYDVSNGQRRRQTTESLTNSGLMTDRSKDAPIGDATMKAPSSPGQTTTSEIPVKKRERSRIFNRSWKSCCWIMIITLLILLIGLVTSFVLEAFGKTPTLTFGEAPPTFQVETAGSAGGVSNKTDSVTRQPSSYPVSKNSTTQNQLNASVNSTLTNTTASITKKTKAPTPSPLNTNNVTIVIILQLDGKPSETGFLLTSADNVTTYASKPKGSFTNMESELVMEVFIIPVMTEMVFTFEDASGDGLCCTFGDGYYKVFAGTGDQKTTLVSGDHSGMYTFTVGEQQAAVQIDGVDPNESCKPCTNGKDCGRCAWCNADQGFMSDTVFSYQCHSKTKSIPKKCWTGETRFMFHDSYVVAMAGCSEGLESWPQMKTSTGNETTVCVEETKCIKSNLYEEPDCEQELPGSSLVRETCQDKIGGIAFGYHWTVNAPREKDCSSMHSFTESIASRCCIDGLSFCSTSRDGNKEDDGKGQEEASTPAPTPITIHTASILPTVSYAPTWDGYQITVLIQLDNFPQETGFSISSVINGKNVTFLQRREGYYKQSQLLVEEKVKIPEGINAVITLTDKAGDGFCCENGGGYFQVYSSDGAVIVDEKADFEHITTSSFIVGEPESLPPTGSSSPSTSLAPSFDHFPITIAIQLDQWSGETGLYVESASGETLFDWPTGNFTDLSSTLFVDTVYLPNDSQVSLVVTDTGGDGFCCLYGDGFIKVFAGESSDDESALLAFDKADFGSELEITFRVGPAPSISPAISFTPTVTSSQTVSTRPTTSSPPSISGVSITVVLQLDEYSSETSWSIDSSDRTTNFVSRPTGYYEGMKSQKIIETVRVPDGLEYQFKIVDFMGDGFCCWAGKGWYELYEGLDIGDEASLIFHGNGDFGMERVHSFTVGGELNKPGPSAIDATFPTSNITTPMLRGTALYKIERQRQHEKDEKQ